MWRDAAVMAGKDLRIELRSRVATNQVAPFALLVLVLFAFALDPDRGVLARGGSAVRAQWQKVAAGRAEIFRQDGAFCRRSAPGDDADDGELGIRVGVFAAAGGVGWVDRYEYLGLGQNGSGSHE